MTSVYTGLKNSEELRILATVKQVAILDRDLSVSILGTNPKVWQFC
jgi:hypothetical protein